MEIEDELDEDENENIEDKKEIKPQKKIDLGIKKRIIKKRKIELLMDDGQEEEFEMEYN